MASETLTVVDNWLPLNLEKASTVNLRGSVMIASL